MKNIRIIISENFHFLVIKFLVYLNRNVFIIANQIGRVMQNVKTYKISQILQ